MRFLPTLLQVTSDKEAFYKWYFGDSLHPNNTGYQLMADCITRMFDKMDKETAEEDLEIYVDKNRLTQVLTNFLNNDSKFTPCGYIKLGYHYLPKEQQVHIFVEDSGKGIPQAEQKMIFSRFYKQDEFAQGTGLGLSICHVIIEKLGGHIHLWSEPGKGSRFNRGIDNVLL